MNLKDLQAALTREQRTHMKLLYGHIENSARMGYSELTFESVGIRDYNETASLTEEESYILRQDGYSVSWNKYTERYTVSGW